MIPQNPVHVRPPADPAAWNAAQTICRRHARSFYFASFFLPKHKRRAAYAVYAFCRLLDDAVDTRPGREAEGIAEFEAALEQVYAGRAAELPRDEAGLAMRAFEATVQEYEIPRRYFDELADGCRMDLTLTRYQTWPELEKYCYHVAGVVGLIMSCIFGPIDEPTRRQAVAMGNAMQLTNILRDVKEDLDRGRIYLPQEDLRRFGVDETALRAGRVDRSFTELMKFEIARARQLYAEGAAGLGKLANDGSRFTAAAMAEIYGGILGAIEARGYDVFSARASLSFWQKIAKIPAARRLAKSPPPSAPAPG